MERPPLHRKAPAATQVEPGQRRNLNYWESFADESADWNCEAALHGREPYQHYRLFPRKLHRGRPLGVCSNRSTSVHVIGLPFHGPDVSSLLLEWVDVNHPAENLRVELASGGFACVFGGNRTVQAEFCIRL
jgi:hypothetical protein